MVSYLKFEEERYCMSLNIFSALAFYICLLYAVEVVRNYRRLDFFRAEVGNINNCSDLSWLCLNSFNLSRPELNYRVLSKFYFTI